MIALAISSDWQPPYISRNSIAFLQYTSGSTMHPKGVIVNHNNLLDNTHKIYQAYAMSDESVFFSWLPPHHDMGLIGCILDPNLWRVSSFYDVSFFFFTKSSFLVKKY